MLELQQPTVTTQPAAIGFDFEAYRSQLADYISKYNIVVTSDSVKDAKKTATELNKLANDIRTGFKKHIDAIKAPADQLSGYSKQLQDMCQEGRKAILEQVDKFESLVLDKARELLTEYAEQVRAELKVNPEFYSLNVEQHVKLGAVNDSATKLSKAGRDAILAAVKDEYGLQQQTELRIAQLEVESTRAGLHAPITRNHVEAFLFADQDQWAARMAEIINAEVERQKITEARIEAERQQAQPEPAPVQTEQAPAPEPAPAQQAQDRRTVTVWVRFDIEGIPAHISSAQVGDKVKAELERLGKQVAEVRS